MAEQGDVHGRHRRWPWAVAVLIGVVLAFVLPHVVRSSREERWVDAACAAVERHLKAMPGHDLPGGIGTFQVLRGKGYHYPVWNINAPHIIGHREAVFDNATLPVLVYVWEPPSGASEQGQWEVERVEHSQPTTPGMRVFVRLK